MTDTRCWVTYKNDRALRKKMKEGWFTEEGTVYFALDNFPARPANISYWPSVLKEWCRKNGVEFKWVNELTISARVKKHQIEEFIDHVYGNDPSYNDPAEMLTWKGRAYLANCLTDLRALVAQELDPTIWYELNADEF